MDVIDWRRMYSYVWIPDRELEYPERDFIARDIHHHGHCFIAEKIILQV